ncbi:MAG: hypothetical protein KDB68_05200 [Planctomycetes bacterium]|nr:hypothetical protein [Planctomycetota bacterium]MCA8935582.1 hypothetical protein [Planctomycetota bacterium]
MSELAPWESGEGKQPFHPEAPTQKVPRRNAAGRLPEIYKRQTEGFVVPSGNVVPRPPQAPRVLESRGRNALIALGGVAFLGLTWAGLCFVIFSAEAGALRFIYAGIGIALAAVAGVVLLAEMPRIAIYRTGNFIPGILVYGARSSIEKVVGPMAIPPLTSNLLSGSGSGLLSKIFDRSAHNTTPPEIVALHINRGGTPMLVGIEWSAVHELQRGDIVWFQNKGANSLLLFHKLVPYAPWVSQDEATRKEVFEALRVGEIEYQDRAEKKAMGQTKVFNTDADGNLVVGGKQPNAQQPGRGQDTKQLGLSSQGGPLGGNDQYNQSAEEYAPEPYAPDPPAHDYRISEPGKPLGGYDYDPGADNQQ